MSPAILNLIAHDDVSKLVGTVRFSLGVLAIERCWAGAGSIGLLTVITPLVLRRESAFGHATIQSLNWFRMTVGIALGNSIGGALRAFGALALSTTAASLPEWVRPPGESTSMSTSCSLPP